ncbi:hypothetical protein BCU70_10085 [Vibrio sp. 10N.286.49.C2]|uniref:YgiW/YdeI family stress tolerance OB fold protein n=1 Tax=unclassified Vibrio TaxID=2614977 RepID=UPI000C816582|nr:MULTISPECIES: NirD/YgiW/YdeI family stress tolerance protein [unclassified Vibrio]PMH26486.1 hypothetical protein BCU70_10085 [Vibrio sp. 10N.286.49.C2]PMH54790.1 hypothetical protein BCU66_10850 [Vibrio sp. 10N.286.49.B1]PMH83056.1 hypothetical protein BCU58_16170 [Vibrio sp. 10N.286.48.B7]
MKNVIIATTLILSSSLAAANTLPAKDGFNGPSLGVQTTVEEALDSRDDARVELTGKITHSLGDEEYQFTDGKNTIVIEIDDNKWAGLHVTPNDSITITGSIDKDSWEDASIDVNRVVIASQS